MGTNTPNLQLYQFDPTESMANPQTNQFDANWTKISTMDNTEVLNQSTFPQSNPGQLAWFTPLSGAFVCMANQPTWSMGFWKPINKRYGPWQDIPSGVLNSTFVQGTPTAQFRFGIEGTVELRGTLKLAGGNFSTTPGTNYAFLLAPFPVALMPKENFVFNVAIDPFASNSVSSHALTGATLLVGPSNASLNLSVWNPQGNANTVYLDGVQWSIGPN